MCVGLADQLQQRMCVCVCVCRQLIRFPVTGPLTMTQNQGLFRFAYDWAQHGPIHDRTMVHVNFYMMKTHLARPKVTAETETEMSRVTSGAQTVPN